MEWPQPKYPGDVLDIGYDGAMALYEEVPPERRVYTLDEIGSMFSALGELPTNEREWKEWAEGHVEHMAAGGYVIGRPA